MQIIGFDCVEGQVHSWESTSALERLGVLFETVANPSILSILSSLRPSLASRGIATLSNAEVLSERLCPRLHQPTTLDIEGSKPYPAELVSCFARLTRNAYPFNDKATAKEC